MKQKKKKGVWIGKTPDSLSAGAKWIVYIISSLLAVESVLLMVAELSGFTYIYTPWVMLIAAVCVTITYGIAIKLNKQKLFYLTALAVLLVLVIVCGKMILSGGCLFWNQLGDTWTAGTGVVIPEVEIPGGTSGGKRQLFIFSVFAGMLVAMACCAFASKGGYVAAIVLSSLAFTGAMTFKGESSTVYIVLCMLVSVCLLASGANEEKTLIGTLSRWAFVAAFSIALIMAAESLGLEQWTTGTGESIRDKLHALRYETEYTTLPEGDFTEYRKNEGQSQPALVVTMEQPEEMYLRGFTGSVFSGEKWDPIDTAVLAENEELLYWMNQSGWNPQMQFYKATSLTVDTESPESYKSITIQNVNACSEYMYTPYSMCSAEYLVAENLSTDGVPAEGQRTYMYSVVNNGTEKITEVLSELETSEDRKIEEYRKAEGVYRDFVYSHYLEVPEEINAMMESDWNKVASDADNTAGNPGVEVQGYVRAFLEAAFPENGEAPKLSLPLEVVKGSSYQYATVAVMTLRHFGIPARYAEGYVITEEMAENMKNDTSIEVDSSCAGAWAEVYHDGIGWIPVNLTPGIEAPDSGRNQNLEDGDMPQEIAPEQELAQEESEDMSEESEQNSGYVVSVKKVLSRTFLLIIGVAGLLIAAIIIRRCVLLKRRNQHWNTANANVAVSRIFADTESLLNKLGLNRGNGSMQELICPAGEKFGTEYAEEFKAMIDINARAIFSSKPLSEEHREQAKEFYEETLQHMKNDAGWIKKIWMQWILCLH